MTQPAYTKEIVWSRETGDYRLMINGALQGYAANHVDGEILLDGLVADLQRAATSIDAQLAALSDQYKDARAAGNLVLAETLKRAGIDLLAQKYGCSVDELVNRERPPEMKTAPYTIGGQTFVTGDHVQTHLGAGYIVSIDPQSDLPIAVKLHTPKAEGRLFWFTEREVTLIDRKAA